MSTQPRLPALAPAEWSEQARAMLAPPDAEGFVAEDWRVNNAPATLACHPILAKKLVGFSRRFFESCALPDRERELLVLRTAWLSGSRCEWAEHVVIGRQVGLSDDAVARVAEGPEARWDAPDRDLLQAVDDLVERHSIAAGTWQRLRERMDEKQLLDVLFATGIYLGLAFFLNSAGVELDDDIARQLGDVRLP